MQVNVLYIKRLSSVVDSLSLIVVMGDDQADDCHMFRLLENVWSAMVLHCGRDELVNIKNLERFKREVKVRSPQSQCPFSRGLGSISDAAFIL